MRVSDTSKLDALDAILYDRPAGRNIVAHAIETIKRQRLEIKRQREEMERLRNLLRLLERIDAALGIGKEIGK